MGSAREYARHAKREWTWQTRADTREWGEGAHRTRNVGLVTVSSDRAARVWGVREGEYERENVDGGQTHAHWFAIGATRLGRVWIMKGEWQH